MGLKQKFLQVRFRSCQSLSAYCVYGSRCAWLCYTS